MTNSNCGKKNQEATTFGEQHQPFLVLSHGTSYINNVHHRRRRKSLNGMYKSPKMQGYASKGTWPGVENNISILSLLMVHCIMHIVKPFFWSLYTMKKAYGSSSMIYHLTIIYPSSRDIPFPIEHATKQPRARKKSTNTKQSVKKNSH